MADATVVDALAWLLLAAFLGGLTVALAPYVHDAWESQMNAVADQVTVLVSLPLAPRPAVRKSRVTALPAVSLLRHGRHRAGVSA